MPKLFYQLALLAVLGTAAGAYAQRGPGGPGGPGGGRGGPGMGGPGGMNGQPPRNGDMSNGGMGGPPRSGPQLGPPGRWWDDHRMSKTLKLSPDQQHHMDDIFNANKGQLVALFDNLQHEEQKLASMSPQDLADETKVFAGIDRVAQARAELEKENAHILLQIRKELDSDQLAKLDREVAAR